MAAVQRKHLLLKEAGISSQVLSAAALAKEEPHLRRGLAGGLLVPDDLVVFPPSVTEYFVTRSDRGRCRVAARGGSQNHG